MINYQYIFYNEHTKNDHMDLNCNNLRNGS
jgi:hypothetical protein